ncbi:MAG: GNAT family N-acetyltransferase [Microbacter sp.]
MKLHFQIIHSASDPLWSFMLTCLEASFPLVERRSAEQMEQLLNVPSFSPYVLTVEQRPVGIFNVWDLKSFHYIEHFAVIHSFRGNGVGTDAMHRFLQRVNANVVIEVEKPTSSLAERRIAFYERHGFSLCDVDYLQPPYDKEKAAVPLHLMLFGDSSAASHSDCNIIKQRLYQYVYQVNLPD